MPTSCTPQDLSDQASCFECQLSEAQRSAINTYLLAEVLAVMAPGSPTDPQTLLNLAAQYQNFSPAQLLQIQVYLLCTLMNPL